jgi:hypothetical protein
MTFETLVCTVCGSEWERTLPHENKMARCPRVTQRGLKCNAMLVTAAEYEHLFLKAVAPIGVAWE